MSPITRLNARLRTVCVVAATIAAGLGALVAVIPPASAAVQATFYVSPTGSGSSCAQATPCALTTAQAAVEAAEPTMTGDLVVQLAGGTYSLTSTLNLGAADSGTGGHTVVYQAAPGQTPILSGGAPITGWSLHDAGANIWQASVPVGFSARQIYVNGVVAQLAEMNASVLGTYTKTTTGYTLSSSTLASWNRPTDVDFVYPAGGASLAGHGRWTDSLCAVASVSGTTVTMQQPCFSNASNGNNGPGVNIPTYIENNYALLGQPGQFYIDSAAGTIYYVPRSNETMTTATVIAPNLQTLLSVNGTSSTPVHDLQISGLSFEYAGWVPSVTDGEVPLQDDVLESGSGSTPTLTMMPSAVQVHAAQNVAFIGNTLTHLGGAGVSFDGGGQNDSVTGNLVTDIAGTGIQVGVGPWPSSGLPATLESGDLVNDNYVYNTANRYLGGVGIFAGYVVSTSIVHNEVWDIPYSGISLGWGWNAVSPTGMADNHIDDNYVHDVMTSQLQDGGAIYVNGTQSTTPAAPTIENNYISGDTEASGAIYLDGTSTSWLVENNVITRAEAAPYWLVMNEGYGATCTTASYGPAGPCPGQNNTIQSNYTDMLANKLSAYASQTFYNSDGTVKYSYTNTIGTNYTQLTSWPPAAQAIMAAAGLESAYASLLGGPEQSNLAWGAPTSASSSLSSGYAPALAVDGLPTTGWTPAASDTAPYWQVDLGAAYALSDLQILTRQDTDQAATRQNFAVEVSNSAGFATYSVACSQGSIALPFRSTVDCAPPTGTWRYVRVVTTVSGGSLFLTEVRVYGALDSNLARAGTASASSTLNSGYAPANGNDGSISDGWSPTGTDTAARWQVDLGAQYTLSQVQLVTRQNLDQPVTRQNFAIWVSNNADFSSGHTVACTYTTPALPYQSTYVCGLPPGPWRYVAAVKTDGQYFYLSELRVYGH